MVCFSRKLRPVPVLEDNRIIDVFRGVSCDIGCVRNAICNRIIPTAERIASVNIAFFCRSFRSSHLVTVMVRFSRQLCSVPVLEDDRIIDKFRSISGGIGRVCNAICNRIIPTAERIASVNIAFFCRSFRSSHLVSVVIHIGLQKRSVLIQKADPIFQPNRIVDEVE